ncbi:DNA cytosine methyltransferase [Planktomarina temperata]|nr:DNA cytosine methyltransferase [Planktomarina temperata]
MLSNKKLKAISLFSSSGVGEKGLEKAGVEVIVANEKVKNRAELYCQNFPTSKMFNSDIWECKEDLIKEARALSTSDQIFLVYATPPCQGMSTNGAGMLKKNRSMGKLSEFDPRNQLIIPAMDVICELNPEWVLFENVPLMRNTLIDVDGEGVNIIDYIKSRLGKSYVGGCEVISCSDYGVPQLRKRLLTVFTKEHNGKKFLTENDFHLFEQWDKLQPISIKEALAGIPKLDAKDGHNSRIDFHPLHFVSTLSEKKYWWVSNTPEGDTAFNNQCVNESCMFTGNRKHVDTIENGKAVSSRSTPLYCSKCGSELPRPSVYDQDMDKLRLIKGFHSAYRRMRGDLPARTITRNFRFEASDNKIHPFENRTLSAYEASVIQTLSQYNYDWKINKKRVPMKVISDCLGEAVPPLLIEKAVRKMISISRNEIQKTGQLKLI